MRPKFAATNKRGKQRTKAVLPVRVKGNDSAGKPFEELAITLDANATGLRLGSVHYDLKTGDEISVFYRQRKMQFRVMWTKKLQHTSEFQVGLQSLSQEHEAWVMGFAEFKNEVAISRASGVS
jgi:hypothetical protein